MNPLIRRPMRTSAPPCHRRVTGGSARPVFEGHPLSVRELARRPVVSQHFLVDGDYGAVVAANGVVVPRTEGAGRPEDAAAAGFRITPAHGLSVGNGGQGVPGGVVIARLIRRSEAT